MLLAPQEAEEFFKISRELICFVNGRQNNIPDADAPEAYSLLSPEQRMAVREAWLANPGLTQAFVEANPFDLSDDELETVASWRHVVQGSFFMYRQLKQYMVFMATEDPPCAYGVVALTDTFEQLTGPRLPLWVEAVLLPFKGKIVYDGLLSSRNISFGGGVKRMLNDSYREAKQRQGIITSLPAGAPAVSTPKAGKTPRSKSAARDGVERKLRLVVGLTDEFCRLGLNDEYAELCRKLAEKLARKRPSPLLRGNPKSWAAAIARTIGWINYLDDPTQRPHMKLRDIDRAFGVSESTGQNKSMQIRRMFRLQPLAPEWTLPSLMDENPMTWMIEVNGLVIDARHAPREVQELAVKNGLIPYMPAGAGE